MASPTSTPASSSAAAQPAPLLNRWNVGCSMVMDAYHELVNENPGLKQVLVPSYPHALLSGPGINMNLMAQAPDGTKNKTIDMSDPRLAKQLRRISDPTFDGVVIFCHPEYHVFFRFVARDKSSALEGNKTAKLMDLTGQLYADKDKIPKDGVYLAVLFDPAVGDSQSLLTV
ncbi:hypothetical protein CC80DRAFT_509850 [Byssothecium circinans]|uniref:Uncharacterized protein n=1 Tax=Byssothecium circinans TaxID=147558 RepID=A0A6A5TDE6_9PLEO|nr:hypothetical protein CC80DRAFT_509850 [Byssothecium circinans]